MTPVRLTNEAFAALGGPSLVYVRPVTGAEVIASSPAAALAHVELDRRGHAASRKRRRPKGLRLSEGTVFEADQLDR